jgi:hypothetical protein
MSLRGAPNAGATSSKVGLSSTNSMKHVWKSAGLERTMINQIILAGIATQCA